MKRNFCKVILLGVSALVAVGCCCSKCDAPLVGTIWSMSEYDGEPFETENNYKMIFAENGEVSGVADCNSFMGSYELSCESKIDFENKALTRAMCRNDVMERAFLDMLEEGDAYEISGDELLWMNDGEVVAKFVVTNEEE